MFLESVLEEKAQRKRFDQVLKSLLQAEFLRVSYWSAENTHCLAEKVIVSKNLSQEIVWADFFFF